VEDAEEYNLGDQEKEKDPHQRPETGNQVIITHEKPVHDEPGTEKEGAVHKDNHPIWSSPLGKIPIGKSVDSAHHVPGCLSPGANVIKNCKIKRVCIIF
jgi:hypothetical protein